MLLTMILSVRLISICQRDSLISYGRLYLTFELEFDIGQRLVDRNLLRTDFGTLLMSLAT